MKRKIGIKLVVVAVTIVLSITLGRVFAGNGMTCTSSPDGCSPATPEDNPEGASCQHLENAPAGVSFCLNVPFKANCTGTGSQSVLVHTGTCQPNGSGGYTCSYTDRGQMENITTCK